MNICQAEGNGQTTTLKNHVLQNEGGFAYSPRAARAKLAGTLDDCICWFGTKSYADEELVAELRPAFLCAHFRTKGDPKAGDSKRQLDCADERRTTAPSSRPLPRPARLLNFRRKFTESVAQEEAA